VDVEEHFQVHALAPWAPLPTWDAHPSRVDANTRRLLDLMDLHGARGTFFVLGWVAERWPDLVRTIAARGHEVASHGFWHQRVQGQVPARFREDVRSARELLESLAGHAVQGYRAPSFSIVPGTEWAFDVLLEEGYTYDSSRFPIRRPGYGSPDAPASPHLIRRPAGTLLELPLATFDLLGARLPGAGGGWFRQLPYAFTRAALRQHGRRGLHGMFYIHPWEYDVAQPVFDVPWLVRQRHYGGLARTWPRLERLLGEFAFVPVASRLEALRSAAA